MAGILLRRGIETREFYHVYLEKEECSVEDRVDAGGSMSATQVRRTAPGRGGEAPAGPSEGAAATEQAAPPRTATAGARYRLMFVVPFQTAMSYADIHRLNSVLDMSVHLYPKLHASPASPGVSRLDFFSGLFLVRGDRPREWRLEGRTWGAPAPQDVHLAPWSQPTRHACSTRRTDAGRLQTTVLFGRGRRAMKPAGAPQPPPAPAMSACRARSG
jgi:hypothetical protein